MANTPTVAPLTAQEKLVPDKKASQRGLEVRFLTLGSKGTYLWTGIADSDGDWIPTTDCYGKPFRPNGFVLCDEFTKGTPAKVEWKSRDKAVESYLGKSVGAWVSEAGDTVLILPLAEAVKRKLVAKYAIVADGKKLDAYLPPADYATVKFPRIVGTDSAMGRVETYKKSVPKGATRSVRFQAQAGCAVDEVKLA